VASTPPNGDPEEEARENREYNPAESLISNKVPSRRCLSSEFVRIHCDAAIPHPVAQDGPSGRSKKIAETLGAHEK
jgi:hypothetical protein